MKRRETFVTFSALGRGERRPNGGQTTSLVIKLRREAFEDRVIAARRDVTIKQAGCQGGASIIQIALIGNLFAASSRAEHSGKALRLLAGVHARRKRRRCHRSERRA